MDRMTAAGGQATFRVAATGIESLGYRWQFNSNDLV